MSRREDVDNSIWDDEDFADLAPHAKLIYLWSFTNPRCGMAGLYRVTRRAIVADTGLGLDEIDAAIAELEDRRFLYLQDGVVWVRARVKHLRSRGPGIAKAVAADVAAIDAEHPLRELFIAEYQDRPWPGGLLGALLANLPPHQAIRDRPETLSGGTREVPGRYPRPSREVPETLPEGSKLENRATQGDPRPSREVPETLQGKGKGSSSNSVALVDPTATSSCPADREVDRLCDLFSQLARERTETSPSSPRYRVTDGWRTEMDRLLRIDGRTPVEVEAVIRWVDQDGFWAPNVLSVPKLRAKFDQLRATMRRKQPADRLGIDEMSRWAADLDAADRVDAA